VRAAGDGKPILGKDVVVTVGGAPERGVRIAGGIGGAHGYVLLPEAKDARDFGLSLVRLDEPLREDLPRTWTMYPNGIDPAPTATASQSGVMWAAFARPANPSGKPIVVELGRTLNRESGNLVTAGISQPAETPTDLGVAVDPRGGVWLTIATVNATTLERWECPRK
jgi:hypothetical protein